MGNLTEVRRSDAMAALDALQRENHGLRAALAPAAHDARARRHAHGHGGVAAAVALLLAGALAAVFAAMVTFEALLGR